MSRFVSTLISNDTTNIGESSRLDRNLDEELRRTCGGKKPRLKLPRLFRDSHAPRDHARFMHHATMPTNLLHVVERDQAVIDVVRSPPTAAGGYSRRHRDWQISGTGPPTISLVPKTHARSSSLSPWLNVSTARLSTAMPCRCMRVCQLLRTRFP